MREYALLYTVGMLATFVLLAGTSYAQEETSTVGDSNQNIVRVIQQSESHETLARAIEAANLTELLTGYSENSFTLFAPTDEAFEELPANTAEELFQPENKEELLSVITYHLTSYGVTSEQLKDMEAGDAAQGDSLRFSASGDRITINGEATIVEADITASNGIIHSIDTVLMPPARGSRESR